MSLKHFKKVGGKEGGLEIALIDTRSEFHDPAEHSSGLKVKLLCWNQELAIISFFSPSFGRVMTSRVYCSWMGSLRCWREAELTWKKVQPNACGKGRCPSGATEVGCPHTDTGRTRILAAGRDPR